MLFAIECVCGSILGGFWARVGGIFGPQLELRSDFESRCYKVCFLRGVGTIAPPPKVSSFGAPVGGIREGKPHTPGSPLKGSTDFTIGFVVVVFLHTITQFILL